MRQLISVGLAKPGRSAKRAKTKSRTLCVDRWRTRWSVLSARGSTLHREGGNGSNLRIPGPGNEGLILSKPDICDESGSVSDSQSPVSGASLPLPATLERQNFAK